jgi:hypothetical protein
MEATPWPVTTSDCHAQVASTGGEAGGEEPDQQFVAWSGRWSCSRRYGISRQVGVPGAFSEKQGSVASAQTRGAAPLAGVGWV